MTNQKFLDFVLSCRQPKLDSKLYLAVGMGGECGEVLNEVKKEYRENRSRRDQVLDEAGDTIHYLVSLLERYGITLEEVMDHNVLKLTARYAVKGVVFGPTPTPKPKQSRAAWRNLRTTTKTLRTRTVNLLLSLLDSLRDTLSKRISRLMRLIKRLKK